MRAPIRKFIVIAAGAAAALVLAVAAAAIYFYALPQAARSPATTGGPQTTTAPPLSVPPLDRDLVAQGRNIYVSHCASCHRADASGDPDWKKQNPDGTFPPPPHDSSGHTWHHPDGLLFRIVRDGGKAFEDPGFKSTMPGFGGRLSRDEIIAVITYLKSLWGPEEREFQIEVSKKNPFAGEATPEAAR